MSANKKTIRPTDKLNVQSWQLPDLHGPTVHEVDALGNRSERDARMRRARHPEEQQTEQAEPANTEEPEYQPPTAAELQALRAAAREEGYAEGQKAGYEAGFSQGDSEGQKAGHEIGEKAGYEAGAERARAEAELTLTAEKQALAHQLGAAFAQLNLREKALEDELAPVARDLILRLTQGLLAQSLQQTPEQIETIVHDAIQLMPAAHERMELYLHPDEASLLRSLDLHWLKNVALHADDSLSPGGCTIKTRHSLLDYTLDQRYQIQIQALLDNDLSPPSDALRTLSRDRFSELLELSNKARQGHRAADADSTDHDGVDGNRAEPAARAAGDTADSGSDKTDSDPVESAQSQAQDSAEDDPDHADDEGDHVRPE